MTLSRSFYIVLGFAVLAGIVLWRVRLVRMLALGLAAGAALALIR